MKEIFKCIGIGIIIILPLVFFIMIFYRMGNYRIAMQVNSENIEIVKTLAESINLGITIDENVKEIAVVSQSGDALAYTRYEIVYYNGEVKETETEVLKDKGKLVSYISENSDKYDYGNFLLIAFPISIITSIFAIRNLAKTEKNYEE